MKIITCVVLGLAIFALADDQTPAPAAFDPVALTQAINNIIAQDLPSAQSIVQTGNNIAVNSAQGLAKAASALPQNLDQATQLVNALPDWAKQPIQAFLSFIPAPLMADLNETLSAFPTLNNILAVQLAAVQTFADASNQLAALIPSNQQLVGLLNGLLDAFNDSISLLFPGVPNPEQFVQMLFSLVPPELLSFVSPFLYPTQGEFDFVASQFTAAAQGLASFAQTIPTPSAIVAQSLDFLPDDVASLIPQDFLDGLEQSVQGLTVNDALALSAQLLTSTAQVFTDIGKLFAPNPSFLSA